MSSRRCNETWTHPSVLVRCCFFSVHTPLYYRIPPFLIVGCFRLWASTQGGLGRSKGTLRPPSPGSGAAHPRGRRRPAARGGRRGRRGPKREMGAGVNDTTTTTCTTGARCMRHTHAPWSETPLAPRTRPRPVFSPLPARVPRSWPPARRGGRRRALPSGPRTLSPGEEREREKGREWVIYQVTMAVWSFFFRGRPGQPSPALPSCLVGPHPVDAAAGEEEGEGRHLGQQRLIFGGWGGD